MEFKNSLPECCKTRFQNETFEIYKMIRGEQGLVIPLISAEFFVTKEKEGAINKDNFTNQSLYSINVEYPLDLKNKALKVTPDIDNKSAPLIPIINDQFFVSDSEIEKSNKHSFSEEIPSENPQSIPTINKCPPSTRDKISHLTSEGHVHENDRTEQLENIENLPPENQDITTECKKLQDLNTPEFSVSQFPKSPFDNISAQRSRTQITSNNETSHSTFDQISPSENCQLPPHKDLPGTSTQLMLSQEKNQCPVDQISRPQAVKVIPSLLTQTVPASQSDQPLQYQIQPKIARSPPSSSCSPLSPAEFTVADYTLLSPVAKFRYPPRPYSPSRRNLNSPARRSLFSNRNTTESLPHQDAKKSSSNQPSSSK
ncbi:hypothetical protein CDAR_56781 [Caerostris darwini]|uniref:Uncharacterized protein n=1 Tax=Caerostris darwini TaxID=1538125 RepID=A0AAV4UN35_9ARAC|nr:hypothetical protein CDAR_56781 [Caerostris darwini]